MQGYTESGKPVAPFTTFPGLYERNGKAKPAVAMFAFPVAAIRRPGGRARVFALPPAFVARFFR